MFPPDFAFNRCRCLLSPGGLLFAFCFSALIWAATPADFICPARRCRQPLTHIRFLLVDRVAAELPHMSRAEIEEHEDWWGCCAVHRCIVEIHSLARSLATDSPHSRC
jgi:hypothetical protein